MSASAVAPTTDRITCGTGTYYPPDPSGVDIIARSGTPIGRLYVFRSDPNDVRIVDISLIAEVRGGGVGTELLLGIMRDAEASGRSVSATRSPASGRPTIISAMTMLCSRDLTRNPSTQGRNSRSRSR